MYHVVTMAHMVIFHLSNSRNYCNKGKALIFHWIGSFTPYVSSGSFPKKSSQGSSHRASGWTCLALRLFRSAGLCASAARWASDPTERPAGPEGWGGGERVSHLAKRGDCWGAGD